MGQTDGQKDGKTKGWKDGRQDRRKNEITEGRENMKLGVTLNATVALAVA